MPLPSEGYHLLPGWQNRMEDQGGYRISKPGVRTTSAAVGKTRAMKKGLRAEWQICWAWVAAALIVFDCLSIPLLAFSVREYWVFDLTRIIFWTLSLRKVVERPGLQRMLMIAIEVVLLSLLLAALVQGNRLTPAAQALFRGPELIRIAHLPWLYKLGGLRRCQIKWTRGELRRLEMRAATNVLCTLVLCLLSLHFLTCAWFGAGKVPEGWASERGILELPLLEQYRTSLEWAVSRIPPSQTPNNILLATQTERGIALVATSLAILLGSLFTSVVTNDVSDIRRVRRQQGEAHCQVSDFLETFPVSWELEMQLKDFLRQTGKRVSLPSKREMSELFPGLLYGQLCVEALSSIVGRHELLGGLMLKFPSFQRDLCIKGLLDWSVAPDEALFSAGLSCESMLFVAFDMVFYKQRGSFSPEEKADPKKRARTLVRAATPTPVIPFKDDASSERILKLKTGSWLCESCLWTRWHYIGTAVAGQCTTLLCLSHGQLALITAGHPDVSAELVIHARLHLSVLNDTPDGELTDLPMGSVSGHLRSLR